MAIKKNELYSSLWASCDQLRGGMDASQYKDYILTILFIKYVTDKFKGEEYADIVVPNNGSFDDIVRLKGDKNIGEGIDKVIASLAEANSLRGVIDNAHFNDETKLGKGKEMVDKLSKLVAIFQRPEFDFKNNKAGGDDILGDAYEYLMRNFATESGKSKGQFYTPAEVSRILAKVIGIDKIKPREEDYTVYDPACGSGSLLIKAADEAPFDISIYGQEKESTTAGLAKMNFVLHNKATAEIRDANTFSSPQYFEEGSNDEIIKRFDFSVANPPFSLSNWTDGLKDFGRFDGYGGRPPEKNADFAWLMHILKSLKSRGKAAVILPHGVLFRGNSEAIIRRAIIDKGYIKGIIGLPANLFYGTSIPACIIIIDKEDADDRKGVFIIDASRSFAKDGNKNRLREQDIYKIINTFNEKIIDNPRYARFVAMDEIKIKNDYNLNIPRYIDSNTMDELQDINSHLSGGLPAVDIDSMNNYWKLFPNLKNRLFNIMDNGYYKLKIEKEDVRYTIFNDVEFSVYADKIDKAFDKWKEKVDLSLRSIDESVKVKQYITEISQILIGEFEEIELIDRYDVYEILLSYWQEIMADDVFILTIDGYNAGKEIVYDVDIKENKKGEKIEIIKGWDGKLIPKSVIEKVFFIKERTKIDEIKIIVDEIQRQIDELIEAQTIENNALVDFLNDKDKIDMKLISSKMKNFKKNADNSEEYDIICLYIELNEKSKKYAKIVKELYSALNFSIINKYKELTDEEVKELLVNHKWYYTIFNDIKYLYSNTSHNLANRIVDLVNRYEDDLPSLEKKVRHSEKTVKSHLERMGYKW